MYGCDISSVMSSVCDSDWSRGYRKGTGVRGFVFSSPKTRVVTEYENFFTKHSNPMAMIIWVYQIDVHMFGFLKYFLRFLSFLDYPPRILGGSMWWKGL
jgi:hypothetical protein